MRLYTSVVVVGQLLGSKGTGVTTAVFVAVGVGVRVGVLVGVCVGPGVGVAPLIVIHQHMVSNGT